MQNTDILEEVTTKSKRNWLQAAFDTVSGGFGLVDAVKERIAINKAWDEGHKQNEIDYILLNAFSNNEIASDGDLKNTIEKVVKEKEKQGTLYYGITTNDVLDSYALLSDEHKDILQSARKIDDWETVSNQWNDQKSKESVEEYLNSEKFQTDRQNKIDYILNERMGTDLSTLTEDKQREYIQWHLEATCIDADDITVQDVLDRFKLTGQSQESFYATHEV